MDDELLLPMSLTYVGTLVDPGLFLEALQTAQALILSGPRPLRLYVPLMLAMTSAIHGYYLSLHNDLASGGAFGVVRCQMPC
jgi:hypothetical protein